MSTEKRRRQKAERDARREAERKAAARRELVRRLGIALGLGLLVAGALLVNAILGADEVEELPPDYAAYREQPTACGGEAPPPVEQMSFTDPDLPEVPDGARAVVHTSCGDITIELAPDLSPETVGSFVFLARNDFYDGVVFHRIVEGFVVQAGDPTASGRGGPGYRVPDEPPPEGFDYDEGVVAMANAGRGTTGSQFFVVVGPGAADLPPSFNVLGEVVDGEDTLERIESVPTVQRSGSVERSKPTETVYIEDVEIVEA